MIWILENEKIMDLSFVTISLVKKLWNPFYILWLILTGMELHDAVNVRQNDVNNEMLLQVKNKVEKPETKTGDHGSVYQNLALIFLGYYQTFVGISCDFMLCSSVVLFHLLLSCS